MAQSGNIIVPKGMKTTGIDTGFNKIIDVTGKKGVGLKGLKPIRGSLLVRKTTQYCAPKTASGIVLPPDSTADMVDKKYDIGEVIAIGSEVKEVAVGDVVVYQRMAAMRLPNGLDEATIFKLEETPMAILCVLPPQPEKDRVEFSAKELELAAN